VPTVMQNLRLELGDGLLLFLEMPRAKVFSEARVQPGRFAAVTVKSLSKVIGVQSLSTY
jgi:hypothetical protein